MAEYDYTDVNTGEDFTDSEMEDRYEELLNEVYGEVDIAGYSMSTGHVLREMDYTAFREGFNDWIDSEIQDGNFREYIDGPVCEDCGATLSQDDVTESLYIYDRLVCPSCGEDDDNEEEN